VAERNDIAFMTRALELAAKGRGRTSPNPMVGAVIVKSGRIIAEGYHRRVGSSHAEIAALKAAGHKARGGTMYVTLEPCCHVGRTGPCCDAIIEAGIKRVVYAVTDPDPRVSGRGGRRLKSAGVLVSSGVLRDEAEQFNEYYLNSQRLGRPFVVLKLAQSMDGKIATKSGDSRWISSNESRKLVHRLRAEIDAVVIGAGTARTDDPRLTVRQVKGRNPYRIVVAGRQPIPRSLRLLSQMKDHKTIVAIPTASRRDTKSARLEKSDVTIWNVRAERDGTVSPHDLVQRAHAFGFRSLLVEGGSRLATSFLRSRLVDKVIMFTAPILVGDGVSALGSIGVGKMADAVSFRQYAVTSLGRDWVFVGYPSWTA
jgi:diaminohydroxyphosphoribosylaminopyrimidine deaminase/5-amino-6-(5-phosphoribosylamino)uracil reductase